LQKTHRPQDALKFYEQARAIDAGDAEFLNNFGIVLQDLGRLDAAIEKYTAAIALKPDFTLAIWHRSLAYLLQHDFARGWPDYELRTTSADLPRRAVEFPRWTGGGLAGKTLLVYAEQGLGDEIMFASCIPDVVAAGAHPVIECSPKLETLFRRSFPAARVYATTADRAPPADAQKAPIDMQIPIGSLPLHFRRSRAEFPRHSGYLKGDPARIDAWRNDLQRWDPVSRSASRGRVERTNPAGRCVPWHSSAGSRFCAKPTRTLSTCSTPTAAPSSPRCARTREFKFTVGTKCARTTRRPRRSSVRSIW
jgi:hypothetical protein